MTTEEIIHKHTSLVTGGYEGMKWEAKIQYHTHVTVQAIIDELEVWQNWSIEYSPSLTRVLENRIETLKKEIE